MFKILHLEKSRFFVQTFKSIVEEFNYEIYNAKNVEEAMEIIEKEKIDIVVAALEGNESMFSEMLKIEYRDVSILVLTSTDDMDTRERLFKFGISDYILKNDLSKERLETYFLSIDESHNLELKGRKLEIGVLDDSYLSLNVIKQIFKKSFFSNVTYYSEPYLLLEENKTFDIYLIDLILPKMTGEEVMQKIKKYNPNAIVILISSIGNYKTISNVLNLGADDFLIKPFDRSVFIAKIGSHLRTYFLRLDLEEKNKILEEMAYTDGLTKLYNHRFIMEKLIEEEKRAQRYKHTLSVAMLDIDYFKKVNDTYGHPIGDRVLIDVSKIIKENVRSSDVVGRYGGEEFLIVFTESDSDGAFVAVENIRKKIEVHDFSYIEGNITISGGICGGICELDIEKNNSIIKIADENLYKAKESGRNRIVK